MSRQLRIQFPEANYRVTSRGNRRLGIVEDDVGRSKFFDRVGITVARYGW